MINQKMFSTMPSQKIALSKKDKKWREQCVDAICGMGSSRDFSGKSSRERKKVNYNLVNSILDEKDFNYVVNSYSTKGEKKVARQPARLRDFNLIKPKVELLKGEEINRPFNWIVSAVNGNAISEKSEKEAEMIRKAAIKELLEGLGVDLSQDFDMNEVPALKDFDKWKNYNSRDVREIWANRMLEYIIKEDNLNLKFNQGFENAIIVAEEIYYSGIVNNKVVTRVVNLLNCDYDYNEENLNIEDGDWFKEDRIMTKGQILDYFAEHLTEEQIKLIDSGEIRITPRNQMFPGYGYSEEDINKYERLGTTGNNSNHYTVTHVCWKSMKRIGFLSDFSEGINDLVVDEGFVLTDEMKEQGITIEWKWVSEIWEGTKIGDDFYVNIGPSLNQRRSMDNPYEVKLPYVGMIYNSKNSLQTSIVDLIKPHQYFYNIIWFRLEAEVAKAKGKKLIIDYGQIPRSMGVDLEDWMYLFDNVGIGLINSFEEGTGKLGQGKTSNFNQFTQVDMTLSQSVNQYLGILSKIEQIVDDIVGITRQRQGQVFSTETAQGVERSVSQSSNITEPLFYIHNEVKKKVLTNVVELSKKLKNVKRIEYFTDDLERVFSEIDLDKYSDSDYGLFVTNSSKEFKVMSKLESIANQAISSGSSSYSDIIKTFRANSIAELSREIEYSEEKKQKQQEQQQQAERESRERMQQELLQAEERKAQREDMNKQLDRENELRKALISKSGDSNDYSFDEINYGKQLIEQEKNRGKQEIDMLKRDLEKEKIINDRILKEKELDLKDKEIQSKERIAKDNNRTMLKNKVSGEK